MLLNIYLTTIEKVKVCPNNVPLSDAICQEDETVPVDPGAVISSEISALDPGPTICRILVVSDPSTSPPTKVILKSRDQVQVPVFLTSQVFVNVAPVEYSLPLGTVTSETSAEFRHPPLVAVLAELPGSVMATPSTGPNVLPISVANCQLLFTTPLKSGAVIASEISVCAPALTF